MERASGFDWTEYSVFGGILAISSAIGIYFGCIKGGQNTVLRYFFGNKEIPVVPIALSFITGCISCTTLLGIPTEVYRYGTMVLVQILSQLVTAFICIFVIIPHYENLRVISIFEYMEMRFGKTMRKLTSAIAALSQLLLLPIVLYAPALALNQVTSINVYVLSALICAICLFYTTLGGIKAVIWADTIQAFFMITTVLAALLLGIKFEGGLDRVWQTAVEGDRIEFFKMEFDPTARISFVYFFLSQLCVWVYNYGYHPSTVQRYMSLPTLRQAQQACAFGLVGVPLFFAVCGAVGVVLYAAYQNCDPLTAGMITKSDQILPAYILRFSKTIPGFPAVFISGIVSAAMSTLSACLNTFSGTVYDDFVEDWFREKPSDKAASCIMKLIVIIMGVVIFVLIFMIERLGTIYEVSKALNGAVIGVILGLFFMGTFLPWVTQKGAYVGGAAGVSAMCWLTIGSYLAKRAGKIRYNTKPMSVSGCTFNVTSPPLLESTLETLESDVFYAFRISPFNYYLVGFLITTTVGLLASFATGANDLRQVDPDLFVPIIRQKLGLRKTKENVVYDSVPLDVQSELSQKNCETVDN